MIYLLLNLQVLTTPIQIITDTRKKDKYIWIKIKADPNCLSGVIDNTYDSAEATLNKLINIDDDEAVNFAQAVTPSAPPPDDGSGTTKPSTSRSNSDGSGIIKPSAPQLIVILERHNLYQNLPVDLLVMNLFSKILNTSR